MTGTCAYPGCRWAAVIGDRCATHDGTTTTMPTVRGGNMPRTGTCTDPTCGPDCPRPIRARGLCGAAYARRYRAERKLLNA